MNKILKINKKFKTNKNKGYSQDELKKNDHISLEKIETFLKELKEIDIKFREWNTIKGILISVYYNDTIAKSNRIHGFFSKGKIESNDSIVGARFKSNDEKKHIFTHYVSKELYNNTIIELEEIIRIIKENHYKEINYLNFNTLKDTTSFDNYNIKKTKFKQMIFDMRYIEKFDIFFEQMPEDRKNGIISLYDIKENLIDVLDKVGINIDPTNILDNSLVLLDDSQYSMLKNNASYLVAMGVKKFSDFNVDEKRSGIGEKINIDIGIPSNEPTIGVFDTMCASNTFFDKWVKVENKLPKGIEPTVQDTMHGTRVTSILVDGPALNPKLDDHCGKFRVRHFCVARNGVNGSFQILKTIEEVVKENKDIKVWNLSLGSSQEISENYISPEAAFLDKIQIENDVIFVISGTNDVSNSLKKKIGAPADSVNSLVVNSINSNLKKATYSRKGPAVSFFQKPDVSYYGGDDGEEIYVCSENNEKVLDLGTSFAAPWIARKMAYLINIMNFSKEEAKALIIDSATKWNDLNKESEFIGYGVVPIKIENILTSNNNEIKFIISNKITAYETYNYTLPVPISNRSYPFIAKLTLCYTPKCNRNQGVDYTNTELDVYFGRLKENGMKSINNNDQDTVKFGGETEKKARKIFRKWDNVKVIHEKISKNNKPRIVYKNNNNWGIKIYKKERINNDDGNGIIFSLVITLKEIKNQNRYDSFKELCERNGWLVNEIDIENQLNIYNKSMIDIEFDK